MGLKIGQTIQLQKEEKQTSLEQTFNDILSILKSKMSQSEKLKWCNSAFEVLESWYKQDELKSVRIAKQRFIPILQYLVEKGSIENMSSFFDYYKKGYCFCARRDFECFVDFTQHILLFILFLLTFSYFLYTQSTNRYHQICNIQTKGKAIL